MSLAECSAREWCAGIQQKVCLGHWKYRFGGTKGQNRVIKGNKGLGRDRMVEGLAATLDLVYRRERGTEGFKTGL